MSTALALPLAALNPSPAAAHPATRPVLAAPSDSGSVARPTLRQGSRGSSVVLLQRKLGGISADGVFGPRTRAAVIAFQRARGLAVDGIVGRRTWGALEGRTVSSRSTSTRASRSRSTTVARASSTGAAVVAEAAQHVGKPYRYGATGPNSFDCSGFVQYVYRQVGVSVPRTSGAQAAAAHPVSRSDKQLGDLIIFRTSGRVSHVGIYAGGGTMWVARRSGTTITRQAIYTGNYSVGRFV